MADLIGLVSYERLTIRSRLFDPSVLTVRLRMGNCLACGYPVQGKRHAIRLKTTQKEARLTERAKELGFTSPTWKAGEYLEGTFDESCFDMAKLMWADCRPHETH